MRDTITNLEEEKKVLNLQMHAEERKRKTSNAEVSASMFNKLLLIEQEKEAQKMDYEQKIRQLEQQLDEIRVGAPRRASEVHSSMFKSLLEAEADYTDAKHQWDQKQTEFKTEIQQLKQELNKLKKPQDQTPDVLNSPSTSQGKEFNQETFHKLEHENKNYQNEITKLHQHIRHLEASKLSMIEECNRQLNFLRTGVRLLNQK
ncbi:hypothetical protein RFI_13795 [Reticulomyxa filosa]|uniref:Viral A-type inclusion protein n=1 Tax=Reticulomyxa filosa TaxID=46433 RepID=X6NDJ0_RETFI|nr:hypothetical protein RFI_13795 [Reticulomyxa filosa]|eukprot:ETO23387.1 hypothetical protein RFI_13795 [Reticulomyxa filosa]